MSAKKAVLIVSHTAAGQMYLGVLLNRIWYSPALAKNAEEAILLSGSARFDLILFDGDSTDIELSIKLLRAASLLKNLPLVLVITSKEAVKNSLLCGGVSAVLTKPLDLALMYAVLAGLSGQPRHTARIPTKFVVEIKKNVPEKKLICINLSEGGMYLLTHKPLPEGMIIHVRFSLPHNTLIMELASEVVRIKPLGTKFDAEPGMGLRFLDVREDVKARIRNFVQLQMMGDLDGRRRFEDRPGL